MTMERATGKRSGEGERPLILFDFGGTLNSNGDHWGALFRQMLTRLFPGHPVEVLEGAYIASERRLSAEGLEHEGFDETLRRQIGYQFESLGAGDRRDESMEEAARFYAEACSRMEEVRLLFADLVSAADVGIVSNFYGNIPAIVEEFRLGEYLSVVVDSALAGVRKPDPAIWLHAIEVAGGNAEHSIIVGDSWKNDIAPALAIGARAVWYRGLEWRPTDRVDEGVVQVRSIAELRNALERFVREFEEARSVPEQTNGNQSGEN